MSSPPGVSINPSLLLMIEGLKPAEFEDDDDDCMIGGREMNDGADLVRGLLELLVDEEEEVVVVFGDIMLAPEFWVEVSIRAGGSSRDIVGNG